jgi:Family of unknown function (DUF6508)
MEGLTDEEVERRLLAAPEARWSELSAAVAALDAEDDHGRWAGGEPVDTVTVDGIERAVLQMPYVVYNDPVPRVIQCVYALGASLPFDWRSWDGFSRYPQGRGLDAAPVAESVRMVTAIVRADRFSEGTILASLHDGTFNSAIRRLWHWHDEKRPGT